MVTARKRNDCRSCAYADEVYSGKYVCDQMNSIMGRPLTFDNGSTTYCFAKCCGEMWSEKKNPSDNPLDCHADCPKDCPSDT